MFDYVSNDVETAALLAAEQDPGEDDRPSRAEVERDTPSSVTGCPCADCRALAKWREAREQARSNRA